MSERREQIQKWTPGTQPGVRTSLEGFSIQTTGIVMTGYYVGFLVDSIIGPKLVKNVDRIRAFKVNAAVSGCRATMNARVSRFSETIELSVEDSRPREVHSEDAGPGFFRVAKTGFAPDKVVPCGSDAGRTVALCRADRITLHRLRHCRVRRARRA